MKYLLAVVAVAGPQGATGSACRSVTLSQAVEGAVKNYPSIRVTQEQMNAAAAGIRLAQTAYLPRVDGLAQVNRATRNTFYGLLLPQGVIPGVDGIKANNLGSVWDSGLEFSSRGSLLTSACVQPTSRRRRRRRIRRRR